jgi:hypothetical protein
MIKINNMNRFTSFPNGFNNTAKRSRRYIPDTINFDSEVRSKFNEHIRLFKDNEGNYQMFITPMFINALNQINRGRLNKNHLKLPTLVRDIQDKIPTNVRGIIKKGIVNKMNEGLGMYLIDTVINGVEDGTIIFKNPNK